MKTGPKCFLVGATLLYYWLDLVIAGDQKLRNPYARLRNRRSSGRKLFQRLRVSEPKNEHGWSSFTSPESSYQK
jgi:hypothetical protein